MHSHSTSGTDSRFSSQLMDSTTQAAAVAETQERDRRRSTLAELPGTLVRGVAGRLRAWRTSRARQTQETGTTLIMEGPSTSTNSNEGAASSMSAFRRRMQAQMEKDHFPE